MATEVFGQSDDLIEFRGDFEGEIGAGGTEEDDELGVLVAFDDGTILAVKYGKQGMGVWSIAVLREGDLFDRLHTCFDEDASPYSDVAYFKSGKLRAWHGRDASRVR